MDPPTDKKWLLLRVCLGLAITLVIVIFGVLSGMSNVNSEETLKSVYKVIGAMSLSNETLA